jgi:hypothetical protein
MFEHLLDQVGSHFYLKTRAFSVIPV